MKKIAFGLFVSALAVLMLTPISTGVNQTLVNNPPSLADGSLPPPPLPPGLNGLRGDVSFLADGSLPPPPLPPLAPADREELAALGQAA